LQQRAPVGEAARLYQRLGPHQHCDNCRQADQCSIKQGEQPAPRRHTAHGRRAHHERGQRGQHSTHHGEQQRVDEQRIDGCLTQCDAPHTLTTEELHGLDSAYGEPAGGGHQHTTTGQA
jgi:hypothetical protein